MALDARTLITELRLKQYSDPNNFGYQTSRHSIGYTNLRLDWIILYHADVYLEGGSEKLKSMRRVQSPRGSSLATNTKLISSYLKAEKKWMAKRALHSDNA